MADALVLNTFFGRPHWLAKSPYEWTPSREEAARFSPAEAQRLVDRLGGVVVLLDQQRTVAGTLGRESERGPRG